ncbi:Peptidase U49 [Rhizobiales bacterium GAS113]|nr:Peptidase U49 [Rhizobiales bacterium GAS113]
MLKTGDTIKHPGTAKDAIITLMRQAAPERVAEIDSLWGKYDPEVVRVPNARQVTLNATKDRIAFDAKTMDVFWLIGFAGWKAIECYSPAVRCSPIIGRSLADLLAEDVGLDVVERAYKERLAAARTLIDAADPAHAPWPNDLPRPGIDRKVFEDPQYKVAYDLSYLALAFALFHEFRHVMLAQDRSAPADRREEEMACDVWAREFMTVKLADYARANGHDYHEVLRKRSMGFALAGLILHEITPVWEHGGNQAYFSLAARLQAILGNTPLPDTSHFWVFTASLLVGIFRQKHITIDAPVSPPRELASYLIARL